MLPSRIDITIRLNDDLDALSPSAGVGLKSILDFHINGRKIEHADLSGYLRGLGDTDIFLHNHVDSVRLMRWLDRGNHELLSDKTEYICAPTGPTIQSHDYVARFNNGNRGYRQNTHQNTSHTTNRFAHVVGSATSTINTITSDEHVDGIASAIIDGAKENLAAIRADKVGFTIPKHNKSDWLAAKKNEDANKAIQYGFMRNTKLATRFAVSIRLLNNTIEYTKNYKQKDIFDHAESGYAIASDGVMLSGVNVAKYIPTRIIKSTPKSIIKYGPKTVGYAFEMGNHLRKSRKMDNFDRVSGAVKITFNHGYDYAFGKIENEVLKRCIIYAGATLLGVTVSPIAAGIGAYAGTIIFSQIRNKLLERNEQFYKEKLYSNPGDIHINTISPFFWSDHSNMIKVSKVSSSQLIQLLQLSEVNSLDQIPVYQEHLQIDRVQASSCTGGSTIFKLVDLSSCFTKINAAPAVNLFAHLNKIDFDYQAAQGFKNYLQNMSVESMRNGAPAPSSYSVHDPVADYYIHKFSEKNSTPTRSSFALNIDSNGATFNFKSSDPKVMGALILGSLVVRGIKRSGQSESKKSMYDLFASINNLNDAQNENIFSMNSLYLLDMDWKEIKSMRLHEVYKAANRVKDSHPHDIDTQYFAKLMAHGAKTGNTEALNKAMNNDITQIEVEYHQYHQRLGEKIKWQIVQSTDTASLKKNIGEYKEYSQDMSLDLFNGGLCEKEGRWDDATQCFIQAVDKAKSNEQSLREKLWAPVNPNEPSLPPDFTQNSRVTAQLLNHCYRKVVAASELDRSSRLEEMEKVAEIYCTDHDLKRQYVGQLKALGENKAAESWQSDINADPAATIRDLKNGVWLCNQSSADIDRSADLTSLHYKILEKSHNDQQSLIYLADIHFTNKQWLESAKHYQKLVLLNNDNFHLKYLLGITCLNGNDLTVAKDQFMQIDNHFRNLQASDAEGNDKIASYTEEHKQAIIGAKLGIASILVKQHKKQNESDSSFPKDALMLYQEVLKIETGNKEALLSLAFWHYEKGDRIAAKENVLQVLDDEQKKEIAIKLHDAIVYSEYKTHRKQACAFDVANIIIKQIATYYVNNENASSSTRKAAYHFLNVQKYTANVAAVGVGYLGQKILKQLEKTKPVTMPSKGFGDHVNNVLLVVRLATDLIGILGEYNWIDYNYANKIVYYTNGACHVVSAGNHAVRTFTAKDMKARGLNAFSLAIDCIRLLDMGIAYFKTDKEILYENYAMYVLEDLAKVLNHRAVATSLVMIQSYPDILSNMIKKIPVPEEGQSRNIYYGAITLALLGAGGVFGYKYYKNRNMSAIRKNAGTYFQRREFENSIEEYRQLQTYDPGNQEIAQMILVANGYARMEKQNTDGLMEDLTNALANNAPNREVLFLRAQLFLQQANPDTKSSISDLEQILIDNPDDLQARNLLAGLKGSSGDMKAARDHYDFMVKTLNGFRIYRKNHPACREDDPTIKSINEQIKRCSAESTKLDVIIKRNEENIMRVKMSFYGKMLGTVIEEVGTLLFETLDRYSFDSPVNSIDAPLNIKVYPRIQIESEVENSRMLKNDSDSIMCLNLFKEKPNNISERFNVQNNESNVKSLFQEKPDNIIDRFKAQNEKPRVKSLFEEKSQNISVLFNSQSDKSVVTTPSRSK